MLSKKQMLGFLGQPNLQDMRSHFNDLHEHEVALVGVHARGSGSMAEKPDSVVSHLKV
jgi:hypothetical protein